MSARHQASRKAFIAAGKCPECAGREDLIPGKHYGAECQARTKARRHPVSRARIPAPDQAQDPRTVWDRLDDLWATLGGYIAEAEQDLGIEARVEELEAQLRDRQKQIGVAGLRLRGNSPAPGKGPDDALPPVTKCPGAAWTPRRTT